MNVLHKIRQDYAVQHTDNRGRDWMMRVYKNGVPIGVAPNTWVDQIGYEKVTDKPKRMRTLRAWFKTLDHFNEYMKQDLKLAVLANAKETNIPENAAREVKDYVRIFEVKVDGEPQLHEIGAYFIDVEIVRFDP